ncbi:hypothetical protein ADUPG1_005899 [Aduncisulcus paluster]|uniref:Uncharacterized protein n=1 Tax=Aduncisulcus paluster TaxID=2918883 RepID=A0ABQ5KJI4_9EUKA|nr:hypothetical protein ADUPG1_005899 [Aduncisulcus paluster]
MASLLSNVFLILIFIPYVISTTLSEEVLLSPVSRHITHYSNTIDEFAISDDVISNIKEANLESGTSVTRRNSDELITKISTSFSDIISSIQTKLVDSVDILDATLSSWSDYEMTSVKDLSMKLSDPSDKESPLYSTLSGEYLDVDRGSIGVFIPDFISDEIKEDAHSIPTNIYDLYVNIVQNTPSSQMKQYNISSNSYSLVQSPLLFSRVIPPSGLIYMTPSMNILDSRLDTSLKQRVTFDPRSTGSWKSAVSLKLLRGAVVILDTSFDAYIADIINADNDIFEKLMRLMWRTTDLVLTQFSSSDYISIVSTDGEFDGNIARISSSSRKNVSDLDGYSDIPGLFRVDDVILKAARSEVKEYFSSIDVTTYLANKQHTTHESREMDNQDDRMLAITLACDLLRTAVDTVVKLSDTFEDRINNLIGRSATALSMSTSHPLPAGSPLHLFVVSMGAIFHQYFTIELVSKLKSNDFFSAIIPIFLYLDIDVLSQNSIPGFDVDFQTIPLPHFRHSSKHNLNSAMCNTNGLLLAVDIISHIEGWADNGDDEETCVSTSDIIHRYSYGCDSNQMRSIEDKIESFVFSHCFSIFRAFHHKSDSSFTSDSFSLCPISTARSSLPVMMISYLEYFLSIPVVSFLKPLVDDDGLFKGMAEMVISVSWLFDNAFDWDNGFDMSMSYSMLFDHSKRLIQHPKLPVGYLPCEIDPDLIEKVVDNSIISSLSSEHHTAGSIAFSNFNSILSLFGIVDNGHVHTIKMNELLLDYPVHVPSFASIGWNRLSSDLVLVSTFTQTNSFTISLPSINRCSTLVSNDTVCYSVYDSLGDAGLMWNACSNNSTECTSVSTDIIDILNLGYDGLEEHSSKPVSYSYVGVHIPRNQFKSTVLEDKFGLDYSSFLTTDLTDNFITAVMGELFAASTTGSNRLFSNQLVRDIRIMRYVLEMPFLESALEEGLSYLSEYELCRNCVLSESNPFVTNIGLIGVSITSIVTGAELVFPYVQRSFDAITRASGITQEAIFRPDITSISLPVVSPWGSVGVAISSITIISDLPMYVHSIYVTLDEIVSNISSTLSSKMQDYPYLIVSNQGYVICSSDSDINESIISVAKESSKLFIGSVWPGVYQSVVDAGLFEVDTIISSNTAYITEFGSFDSSLFESVTIIDSAIISHTSVQFASRCLPSSTTSNVILAVVDGLDGFVYVTVDDIDLIDSDLCSSCSLETYNIHSNDNPMQKPRSLSQIKRIFDGSSCIVDSNILNSAVSKAVKTSMYIEYPEIETNCSSTELIQGRTAVLIVSCICFVFTTSVILYRIIKLWV